MTTGIKQIREGEKVGRERGKKRERISWRSGTQVGHILLPDGISAPEEGWKSLLSVLCTYPLHGLVHGLSYFEHFLFLRRTAPTKQESSPSQSHLWIHILWPVTDCSVQAAEVAPLLQRESKPVGLFMLQSFPLGTDSSEFQAETSFLIHFFHCPTLFLFSYQNPGK